MDVTMMTKAGIHHREQQRFCQDHAGFASNQNVTTICLCDGASFSEYGGRAAARLAEILPEYLQDNFQRYLYGNPDHIRKEISAKITNELNHMAGVANVPSWMMATTLMAVTMDHEEGKFMALHLGDGTMLWKKEPNRSFQILSSPQNGDAKNQTWLTMNTDWIRHMNYIRWTKPSGKEILLLSDGLDGIEWGKIMTYIEDDKKSFATPFDDYSYVLLKK